MHKEQKIAVVAIHGVGDPKPGATAQDLAQLLVAQCGYQHGGSDCWIVPVGPVQPGSAPAPRAEGLASFSSSFVQAHAGREANPGEGDDLGTRLQDHLMRGTELSDSEKTYAAHRHRLSKRGQRVDVIDLHWGDLSGLQGAVTRILTELYTLVFHLSQLGRDTVHHVAISARAAGAKPSRLMRMLTESHEWADTLLTKPAALLNVMLLLAALWWMPLKWLGTGEGDPPWGLLARLLSGAAALGLWALCWYRGGGRAYVAMATAATALCLAVSAAYRWLPEAEPYLITFAWAGVLGLLFLAFARFYNTRVPGVKGWAAGIAGLALAMAVAGAVRHASLPAPPPGLMSQSAFIVANVIEGLMIALVLTWAVMGLMAVTAVLCGSWLKRSGCGRVVARGVDTGRFGMYSSTVLFVTLTSAAWALVIGKVVASFDQLSYVPMLGATVPAPVAQLVGAHFNQSTQTVSLIVTVLGVLLCAASLVLLPSVLAEFSAPAAGTDGTRLGRWLDRMGGFFTTAASKLIVASAIFFVVWAAFAVSADKPAWLVTDLGGSSQVLLTWLAAAAAGSAASLLVIGGRVFGRLGRLRVALDAALDVDNHFREFPDRSTPRGRIAARTFSLLQALREQGYSRIVIASHSQGTVIVADLLRYLRERHPGFFDGFPELRLFTCGSPLRQLYASRFPALYRWVEADHPGGAAAGPQARHLGVTRWTNAYCTGDYVGRWLWVAPAAELLPAGVNFDDGTHRQLCLGKGAHTHYYDIGMRQVASEVDRLVAG